MTGPSRLLAAASVAALALAACTGAGTTPPSSAAAPTTTAPSASAGASAQPEAHWSYEGADGPAHWGPLDPAYAACSIGTEQSPIDIAGAAKVDATSPTAANASGPSTVVNNGHSVEAAAGPGSSMTVAGTSYALVRMHFHSPTETTVGGARAPVEPHFVHESADGRPAVLAMFVQVGPQNAAWDAFVSALFTPKGDRTEIKLDWSGLLPATFTTYRYAGSLTTPPCTEGVAWFASTVPILMGRAQIDAFTAAYYGNDRPVQPLNGRRIDLDAPPDP